VLGKESSLDLIRQMAPISEAQLEQALAALRSAEFIYEQPTTAGVEYTFKHALTQEVAYNSLLLERRKRIHEQAGQAIESLSATNLADHYGDVRKDPSRNARYLPLLRHSSRGIMSQFKPNHGSVPPHNGLPCG